VISAPEHPDELHRIAGLKRLGLLDTPPEERFDRITRMASLVLGVPIALVSFVDTDRQWFKSRVGVAALETSRDISFCAHAILSSDNGPFIVADTLLDTRFSTNPFVVGEPHVRFYAGQILHDPSGSAVGTLCVIDRQPRQLNNTELQVLADLAAMVEEEFERSSERELLLRLDESEQRKSLILETLTEGLVFQDGDGSILSWNPAAERVLGLSAAEMSEWTSIDPRWSTVHEDGTPWAGDTHPAMEALRTGRAVHPVVMGVNHPNGERVWLRVKSQPVSGDGARPSAVLTVFADITVEREAKRTHQLLSDTIRAAIETSGIGTVLLDDQGCVTYANHAGAHILGEPIQQLSGRSFIELVHPEDRRWVARMLASGSPNPTSTSSETRLGRLSEVTPWIRMHTAPLHTNDPSVVWLVQMEDITQRHHLETVLARSEETARSSLNALEQGVILAASDGTIHSMNPAAERLLGFDTAALSNLWRSGNWETFDEHGAPLSGDARPILRALSTGQPVMGQLVGWRRRDGVVVMLRVSCVPDADGCGGFVVAFTDISIEHQMMVDLRRFRYLFQHANDIITVVDAQGHVLYGSPSTQRVLGYPDGWHHPDGVLGLVHPDDMEMAGVELQALIASGRMDQPFNVRVKAHSGEWRNLESVGVNLLGEPDVHGVVITSRDTTDRQHLADQLAHRAAHDELTDLPNRRMLESRLTDALGRAKIDDRHIGLCFIDLDGFKNVNDTLGHAAGDKLLIDVAETINRNIRAGDTAARVGGDEFVVVLNPVVGPSAAFAIASRLRDAIVGGVMQESPGITFGASVGLAISEPHDTPSSLLKRADTALYRAKAHHGSVVELAPEVLSEPAFN